MQRSTQPTRRGFLTASSAALAAAAVANSALQSVVYAGASDLLKVGLIGCGGRGTGAAANALRANPNNKLTALGDMFPDQFDIALSNLATLNEIAGQVDVKPENKYSGWDAYKGVIAASDVVLLATPPHFRPLHIAAVIEAGKPCFCEKPVGVDATGVRSVMETVELAKKKNLTIVSGLCFRYDEPKQETVKRIHDGAIGDILTIQSDYLTTGLWYKPRKPDWSDLEWQLRDWLYFTWLSGDHVVEQHIHSLDKALWVMQDVPPKKVLSSGGRTVRTEAQFGNVFDHFNNIFEWENGVKCFSACRQWTGKDEQIAMDESDWVCGTDGKANVQQQRITGKNPFRKPDSHFNKYDVEHQVFFNAIRSGNTINNGDYMCKATLMGIMARQSAYTGKVVTWDQVLASQEDFRPAKYEFGPWPTPPIAVPGTTKLI